MTRISRASGGAALLCAFVLPASAHAAAVPVIAGGSADVAAAVADFRTTLGTLNLNTAGTVNAGRREIDWDGVPDATAAPSLLPPDFFNVNSPRGVILTATGSGFQVSADASNPTSTQTEFGNLGATYPGTFTTFSAERLFTPLDTNITDVAFFVAGSSRPATVSGFGAVFTDVDVAGRSQISAIGQFGQVLATVDAPPSNGDVSFAGVSFDAGERIARVRIISGLAPLDGSTDAASDKVALDDFIYGEPAQPRLSISDAAVTEGDDGSLDAVFTVTRDVDTSTVFSVPYSTLGDGAADGSDYTAKAGTLAFNAGVLSRTIEIPVLGDKVDEADEAFRVLLLDDGQATIAGGGGRAVIADDDPTVVVSPTVTVTPAPVPATPAGGYDPSKDTTAPKVSAKGVPRKCTRKDFTVRIGVVEDGLALLRVKLDKGTLSDRATAAAVTERLKLRVPARALRRGRHKLTITARDRAKHTTTRTIAFRRC